MEISEPTVRSILRVLVNSRNALGLSTRILSTCVRDGVGNSLAENSVPRIRGLTRSRARAWDRLWACAREAV